MVAVPDDYCAYSAEPVKELEQPDLSQFEKVDLRVDKDEQRTAFYKKLVSILVFTAGLLLAVAVAVLAVFR